MEMLERIKSYLISGGLFNPEFAEHDKVRDLIIDCREELLELIDQRTEFKERIAELERELAALRHERNVLQKICAERSDELAAAQATISRKDEALREMADDVAATGQDDIDCNAVEARLREIAAIPADRTALDAMLAEARKEGMQWQPIETAANDEIDEFGGCPGCLCLLSPESAPEGGYRYMVANALWLNKFGKKHGVTHWMPLPEPPDAIRQAAERSE